MHRCLGGGITEGIGATHDSGDGANVDDAGCGLGAGATEFLPTYSIA